MSPQLWQEEDAPRYIKGCISSIVSWVLLITTYTVYYFIQKKENARRDRLHQHVDHDSQEKVEKQIGVSVDSDETDRQDLKFRYTL